MNYKISFQERARLGMEVLSRQSPVTLEKARAQAKRLSENSISKKKNNYNIMMKCLLIGLNFFYLTVASSQNLEKINSIEEAESFIQLNPKAAIRTLEITNDSLDYYKNRFLEKDMIDKNRIVKTEPIISMRVSYIYLDGSKLTNDNINKKRQEIIKLYKKGKSFGELVATYSMDSNVNKGDLGWFNEGTMYKAFEDAIKSHKKNDLFEVDIPENRWYYVVLKTYNDLPKSILYILSVLE